MKKKNIKKNIKKKKRHFELRVLFGLESERF
jgi:hypothetical protein